MRVASILLFVVGLAGWSSGCLVSSGAIPIGSGTELPPALPYSVAVDSEGRVYVAVNFFSRVQQYGPDGTFRKGWFVETGGGIFLLRTMETGQLEVFVSRGDRLLTFDADGQQLASKDIGRDLSSDFNDNHAISPSGWEVNVENPVLWPRVVKTDPGGNRQAIARTPAYFWLFMGPLPGWIVLAASSALFLRSQRTRHGKSKLER